MIEEFATLYVSIVEPVLQGLLVLAVILTLLWLLILVNDAKKAQEFINSAFAFMWKGLAGTVVVIAKGVWWMVLAAFRLVHEVYRVIYEFLFKRA